MHSIYGSPVSFLGEQIDAVLTDIGADAVKTGMLPNAVVVEIVASKVRLSLRLRVWANILFNC